jgi:hypothetical protein
MTPAILRESASSTDKNTRVVDHDELFSEVQFVTAPAPLRADKATFVVFATAARAVGWVVESIRSAASSPKERHIEISQQSRSARRIAALWEAVDDMRSLHADWNGYGSEAPSDFARDIAKQILLSATGLEPSRVVPSAQGGVGICFSHKGKYGDIECLNTGEILATTSDGTNIPEVWEVKPSESKGALERIGHFINS